MNDSKRNQFDDKNAGRSKPGHEMNLLSSLRISVIATIVLAVVVSGIYPAVVWGLAQALFKHAANGSLIGKDGKPVSDEKDAAGSSLIGQGFSDAKYFHSRPSSAGSGYDATASVGSNLGPTSAQLLFGATKNLAVTIIARDKAHSVEVAMPTRVEATVVSVMPKTITVSTDAGAAVTYPLAAAVADPAAVVNYHGRTVRATTLTPGTKVELKLDGKPAAVTAINAFDSLFTANSNAVDTTANTITLAAGDATNVASIAATTLFIVNDKADAKITDITPDMAVRVLAATIENSDGLADRVVHYCEDNNIPYSSSIAASAFKDQDGIDDANLITAFNASATPPTITPKTAIPADAVTGSASGLDPHISPANAKLQAQRVADARKMPLDTVNQLIEQNTDGASLGFLGDPGVNVLKLNLALDQASPPAPAAAAEPTTGPATGPTTAP